MKIIRINYIYISLILFSLLLLTTSITKAFEVVNLPDVKLPLEHPGETNAHFFTSGNIHFDRYTSDLDSTFGIYGREGYAIVSPSGKIEGLDAFSSPDSYPTFNRIVDVYVSRDQPVSAEFRLIQGSICIYGEDIPRQCSSADGDVLRFSSQNGITIFVDGDIGSVYNPSITVGNGRERLDLRNDRVFGKHDITSVFFNEQTLYRIAFLDMMYVTAYTNHVRSAFTGVRRKIKAWENATQYRSCPCETFDFNNPRHRDGSSEFCPIPGYAEGYIPERIEYVPKDLGACPPEPTETERKEFRQIKNRYLAYYVRGLPKFASLSSEWFFSERRGRSERQEIIEEFNTNGETLETEIKMVNNLLQIKPTMQKLVLLLIE